MASENEDQNVVENGACSLRKPVKNNNNWVLMVLRVIAFLGTAAATIVMGLNKETKSFVVATIGTTPLKATLTAKFQDTPAFVLFVIANGMASLHNLEMILVDLFAKNLDYKGLRLAIIAILDMMTVALISGGVNAAVFMAELGKNGNSHARWNKICDRFGKYCDQGGGAIIASFLGLLFMIIISVISIIKLVKPKPNYAISASLNP